MEGLYIAGEPGTNSEASLVVSWEWNPALIRSDDDPDFVDISDLLEQTNKAEAMVHISFNQVNMKKGSFSPVIKVLDMT